MAVSAAVTSVSFGEGRRPETSTLVTLPDFDGPLGLLLALIESQRLDVLTVPLGALAGAYLDVLVTRAGPNSLAGEACLTGDLSV